MGAFSAEECRMLGDRAPWPDPLPAEHQSIVEASTFACELGLLCDARMGVRLAWLDDLTMTVNYRLGWHVDPARGATHKACLYIDVPESAGIQFGVFEPHPVVASNVRESLTVPCAPGTLVLFDIALVHRARGVGPGTRRVLGLRATVGA